MVEVLALIAFVFTAPVWVVLLVFLALSSAEGTAVVVGNRNPAGVLAASTLMCSPSRRLRTCSAVAQLAHPPAFGTEP